MSEEKVLHLQGWRPPAGMKDDLGQDIEDRIYNQSDMDRVLVLNQRTRLVASKVCDYWPSTGSKTESVPASNTRASRIPGIARNEPRS